MLTRVMPPFTIRPARPEDGPAFIGLVRALAEFEKLPGPTDEAAARLLADAFGERPRYQLLVAETHPATGSDEPSALREMVAYAVTFETYSTFLAKPTLYLEDLFVHPRARRQGIAKAMMAHLRDEAARRGCGRFEWTVLDWNTDAQTLYDSLGAEKLRQWILYRITL
jgi:GNAT superfamily N-acetyltransferase